MLFEDFISENIEIIFLVKDFNLNEIDNHF